MWLLSQRYFILVISIKTKINIEIVLFDISVENTIIVNNGIKTGSRRWLHPKLVSFASSPRNRSLGRKNLRTLYTAKKYINTNFYVYQ